MGESVEPGAQFEDGVHGALAVVAHLLGGAVSASVLAPQMVASLVDGLPEQGEAHRVGLGGDTSHPLGVDSEVTPAVLALACQELLASGGVVVSSEFDGLAGELSGIVARGPVEQFGGGVDCRCAALLRRSSQRHEVVEGEVACVEAFGDVGHLVELLGGLGQPVSVAGRELGSRHQRPTRRPGPQRLEAPHGPHGDRVGQCLDLAHVGHELAELLFVQIRDGHRPQSPLGIDRARTGRRRCLIRASPVARSRLIQ